MREKLEIVWSAGPPPMFGKKTIYFPWFFLRLPLVVYDTFIYTKK